MSSSSALVVGVALALVERARLRDRDEWQRHLRRVDDLAWYLGCVENGLNFPGLPGSAGVGTHGGSEDHTAILACQTDHVSLYRFVPVRPLGDTRDAGRLDLRDRLERRAGRQGGLGHGSLQPRLERRARAACDSGTSTPRRRRRRSPTP